VSISGFLQKKKKDIQDSSPVPWGQRSGSKDIGYNLFYNWPGYVLMVNPYTNTTFEGTNITSPNPRDPGFFDEESRNYHLTRDSVAVDRGDPGYRDPLWDDSDGSRNDMGALSFSSFYNSMIVVGEKHNGNDTDWWIKKYDSATGQEYSSWNKIFYFGGRDMACGIHVDTGDTLYVCGAGIGGRYSDYYYNREWIIRKFSPTGDLLPNWDKHYNLGYSWWIYARDMVTDSDNNVYIAGKAAASAHDRASCIKKYSPGGTEDGSNSWGDIINLSSGKNDSFQAIAIDSLDNIYVSGERNNGTDYEGVIKKFSPGGVEETGQWNKTINNSSLHENLYEVLVDLQDNVCVAGCTLPWTGQM
jgi:hypothetical protein